MLIHSRKMLDSNVKLVYNTWLRHDGGLLSLLFRFTFPILVFILFVLKVIQIVDNTDSKRAAGAGGDILSVLQVF